MGPIRVREVLASGDDRALPMEVALEGLTVPVSGSYDTPNARVSSNGNIHVVVDAETSVTRVARPASRLHDFVWEAMTHASALGGCWSVGPAQGRSGARQ